MKWASTVSVSPHSGENIDHCVNQVLEQLEKPPDLLFLFVSSHFQQIYDKILSEFVQRLSPTALLGCSAGGVIGAGKEVEGMPGISVTAGSLPEVEIKPFHIEQQDLPSLDGSPRVWEALFGVTPRDDPHFFLIADPYSFVPEEWLTGLDFAFPGSAKVGGLASGGNEPGENALFLNDQCYRSGLVGVAMKGNVVVDTAVAQGCYPIGPVLRITDCEEHLLKAVDGQSSLGVLSDILSELSAEEQELAHHSLFLGIVMDSFKESYSHGDFLIRNLIGADSEHGHLFVAAKLHEGQTVQFHLRDAKASAVDLDTVLSEFIMSHPQSRYSGALLFSCLGRGQYLYGRSNHDSERFKHFLGDVALGGFFCNGEIGPVGGTTYLHGYTSCFGSCDPKQVLQAEP